MNKFSEHIKKPLEKENLKSENEINTNNIDTENLENLLNKYSALSHEELMTEFLKESEKLKSNGGLKEEQLSEIEKVLKPHLNTQQQSMFDNLISEIK